MKSKKAVPQKFKDKPTADAFLYLELTTRRGPGRDRPTHSRRGKRNKHGRQHP